MSCSVSGYAQSLNFRGVQPPFFVPSLVTLKPLTHREKIAVARQMNGHRFDPSLILGAERCKFGGVQVLLCAPFVFNKKLFPTTFWLVCPWLVRHAGTVESNSGVKRLENFLSEAKARTTAWCEYNHLHQIIRLSLITPAQRKFIKKFRPEIFSVLRRGGVGGTIYKDVPRVKCLHLQTASFLALKKHPGSDWLTREGLGLNNHCDGRMCNICCEKI